MSNRTSRVVLAKISYAEHRDGPWTVWGYGVDPSLLRNTCEMWLNEQDAPVRKFYHFQIESETVRLAIDAS